MFTSQHSFRTHSSYPLSSGSANSAAAASHEEDDAAGPRNGANLPDGIPRVEEEGNEEEEDGEDDDRAEEEGEDEEEDEDEEEGEAEPNWMHQFTAARAEQAGPIAVSAQNLQGAMPVKVEPVADVGRESGLARQGSGSMPRPLVGAVAPVKEEFNKTSTLDVFQTSGYCAREENLKKEEDAGRIKFVCYSNDGVDQHMIWLIGLKNIFSRQLPNMPKEYIVRLVMDRSHKSMMIIKQNQVIGGITYRPYPSQKFGEIAFCAITAEEQVKGYGTRLMNHLKQYARDVDGLTHFLTYADNNAVGYFSKQGFTKEIELEKERWQGYIKDYDRVTLMECKIDSKLPYINLPEMVRRQRQAIEEKVREYSNYHIIYPGIEVQKKDAGIPQRILSVEDIPGLKEAGWSPEQSTCSRLVNATSEGPPTRQSLHAFMRSLLKVAVEHVDAWPFKQPVDASEVPDYYEVIKDPIDLKTISRRLDSEQFYLTLEMFEADMRRMFANARIYNRPDTIYYKCANRLENFFMSKLQTGIQASSRPQHGTIKTSSPSNVAPKEYSASFDGTAEVVAPTMSDPGSPTPLDREKVNCKAFDKKGRVNCSLFYKCPCTYCEQWRLAKQ